MTFVSFFLSTRGAFPERSSTAGRRSTWRRGPISLRPYGPRTTPSEKSTKSLVAGVPAPEGHAKDDELEAPSDR